MRKGRLGGLLSAAAVAVSAFGGIQAAAQTSSSAAAAVQEDAAAVQETAQAGSSSSLPAYSAYRAQGGEVASASFLLEAAGDSLQNADGSLEIRTDFEGEAGSSVLLPEEGAVSWVFQVPETGYYTMEFRYYPVEGGGGTILRDIAIDGAIPFEESREVSFERRWANEEAERYDSSSNQIRPRQNEAPVWMTKAAMDTADGVAGPLEYYLTAGEHRLTLTAKREPMLLRSITFAPAEQIPSYAECLADYEENGYAKVDAAVMRTLEAEKVSAKSDASMYPLPDRTSPTVSPYSADVILYNAVGGSQWKTVGQWLEWTVDIPAPGLYTIGAHFKQNLKSDAISVRELTIDGKLPFAEAANLSFSVGNSWQNVVFSDESGVPYQFYFPEARSYTLRLRVGLGAYREILTETDACSDLLNEIYREIVVITGTNPDVYRDYQFELRIPETLEKMAAASERLKQLEAVLREQQFSGNQGTDTIKRLYTQLDYMLEDPSEIAQRLTLYRDTISALGTWRNSMTEQPLTLDRLYIGGEGMALSQDEAGFFGSLKHYLLQFFYSFTSDYASIGTLDAQSDRNITVWMTSGRDQAQILKQLINDRFTPDYGIGVSLQLVAGDALLPALLAGTGPDVSLGMSQAGALSAGAAQADPMNLALRGALVDLSGMEGYDEVAARFREQALVPFSLEGGVYALPETMTYPMLFYRQDILDELGIPLSDLETWEDLLRKALPVLQKNALNLGVLNNISTFLTMFYQRGGSLYNDKRDKSGLDSAEAIETMELYANLYTQYGLDYQFDFANRFRSGELPVVITDLMSYNQLTVFAPEIKGLWGMLPVPGTRREDGSVDRAAACTVTGAVLMSSSEDVQAGWEFLRWWTSASVQSSYGRDLESVVGSAARYNSANVEAMASVPWDTGMWQQIEAQATALQAVPEAPGGYFTTRHYDFALRDIVYHGENVRTALEDAAEDINSELAKKRQEYGLD